jgi:chemotaxis family two-component system response regulator Rcp1
VPAHNPSKGQYHIFVAEDSDADRRLIQEAFGASGYPCTVEFARNGAEALKYLSNCEHHPDLILTDLNLPRFDGLSLLRAIKEDEALRMIPVIVLSASADPAQITEVYNCYASCFIRKRGDLHEFFAAIAGLMDYWVNVAILPPKRVMTR